MDIGLVSSKSSENAAGANRENVTSKPPGHSGRQNNYVTYNFENKIFDIPSIKRHLTRIRKKEGTETSFNKLKSFLQSTSINLKDAVSIIARYVEYANETKKDFKETITFVMGFLEKYDSKELDNYIIPLASIYGQVKTEYGIQFISQNICEVHSISEKIELLYMSSDFFCELNKYDNAFKLLRQVNDLCYLEHLSGALRNKGKVSFKMADIGKAENKHDVYLTYCLNGIIYETARELTGLPHIYPYFRAIEEFENKTYFLFEEDYFIEASSKIIGPGKFQEIVLDILKNKLFPIFKVDNSYCNEAKLKTIDLKKSVEIDTTIRNLRTLDVLGEIALVINEIDWGR